MNLKRMKRRWCFLLLFAASIGVSAQQTASYTDENADFKIGMELLQQQKYAAAHEEFKQTADRILSDDAAADHQLLINALYYKAYCSKQLGRPDAEQSFIDLLNDYESNPTTRRAYFQLGDIYFQRKKYDKSLTWLKKVDVNDLSREELTSYKFESGVSYFFKKDFAKAKPFFEELRKNNNDYYNASNYYYGYISYKQGELRNAVSAFKIAAEAAEYKNVVPYYLANIDFMQGNYDQVIIDAADISGSASPYKTEMQQLLGKAYFKKRQYEKALPYFNSFVSASPKVSKQDLYEVAVCQYKTKNYADAIPSFIQLSALNDSIGQNALYLLGDCYLNTGKKNEARLAFDNASKMNEDPFVKEQSLFQFAKISHELDYHDAAVKSLQKYITTYPQADGVEDAKKYLAKEFVSTNNYRDALEVIRTIGAKSMEIRKAYQKVSYGRGTELFNDKDYKAADDLFDESLKNPVDAGLQAACYFWKGEAAFNQKQYEAAITNHGQFLDLATSKVKLPQNVSRANAEYTLGYSYLKLEDYDKALNHFTTAKDALLKSADEQGRRMYADAALRSGDCRFVMKNYAAAAANYDVVINSKMNGGDYALYQKAIIQGLQNSNTEKISTLRKIISDYPSSIYTDDALYELGVAYLAVPAYQDAAQAFTQVTTKFSTGSYAVRSHLKLGLIYFNLDNNAKALEEYKWVLTKYPKTPEGAEALNGVKEIYTDAGDAQGYLAFVGNLPNVNVSDAVKDSVVYLAAESKYSKSDCSHAISEFSNYLNTFPRGAFLTQAHFYRGECLFRQNDFDAALSDYEFVADQPQNRFSEKALLQAARINYVQKKNYEKAFTYYRQLSSNAEQKSNALEAAKGMMYSAYYLNRFPDASNAANMVLSSANASSDDQLEAHFYIAKSAYAANDFDKAFSEFSVVSKSNSSVIGAEAGYRVAEIYFKRNDLTKAEEQSWNVIKQKPTHNYWIAKAYLLLADIYDMQGDFFQSKSTLQSIIDNYKGDDDILPAARKKMEEVKAKEATQSKLLPDNTAQETDSIPDQK